MTLFKPCIKSIGPRDAKIALVGEAPGAQEELTGVPWIGAAGQQLDSMLASSGLSRREIFLTNLLFTHPPGNKLDLFLVGKKELPHEYHLTAVRQGRYLHPDLCCELDRLHNELREVRPNLIITAGGPATWAILGNGAITKLRGAIHPSPFGKVLPILHPATVLYDWSNRVVILRDLMKARREHEFPEIRRPDRTVLVNPTLEDVRAYVDSALLAQLLAVDVETLGGQITLLGFAHSIDHAISIPFYDPRKPDRSYWNQSEELEVWKLCNRLLSSPVPKLFQHGLFDLQYLLREGYQVRSPSHDTLILSHALYPELPKSLGFLGSIYTNEAAWKLMRIKDREELKREE